MSEWAAKVLEGVERYNSGWRSTHGEDIRYADALAAIAKLGAGDGLVERLQECAREKHQEAWGRSDGGQDLTIGAMLADEASAHIAALTAKIEELRVVRRDDALELLAAHGQAQEAYAAQLAAEAERDVLRAERDAALASNRGLVRLNEATEARAVRMQDALEEIAGYDTGATAGLAYTARAALSDGAADQREGVGQRQAG